MITFENLSKNFRTPQGRKTILTGLSLHIPAGSRVAVLGRNGAGKSTLIGLIAGTVVADGGRILRQGSLSWPLGFAGSFAPEMTGAQNVRFAARIYGMDTDGVLDHVARFAEIGDYLQMPVRVYSTGMRARLAFGLSLAMRFDWYLVDEITAVGDAAFRSRSLAAFRERLEQAGLFMVSHSVATLRAFCTSGLVLDGGTAQWFPALDEAIHAYEGILGQPA